MTNSFVVVDRQKITNSQVICRTCSTNDYIETIAIPYVFRYLTTELAAMNVAVRLDLKSFVS
jgi:DNA-directed RNA polymerase beta subunit